MQVALKTGRNHENEKGWKLDEGAQVSGPTSQKSAQVEEIFLLVKTANLGCAVRPGGGARE